MRQKTAILISLLIVVLGITPALVSASTTIDTDSANTFTPEWKDPKNGYRGFVDIPPYIVGGVLFELPVEGYEGLVMWSYWANGSWIPLGWLWRDPATNAVHINVTEGSPFTVEEFEALIVRPMSLYIFPDEPLVYPPVEEAS